MILSMRRFALVSISAALCLGAAAPAGAASADLIGQLRQGGYVLVMRHTDSPGTPPDKASADPANTTLERELNEGGKASAEKMGQAIAALGVPIGDVYSSPTFRALQTARLLRLNAAKPVPELGEGEQGMAANADANRGAWLKKAASTAPKARTNTVLITHVPNLRAAFGADAQNVAAGEALVFQPDGKGAARLVGRIGSADWSAAPVSK